MSDLATVTDATSCPWAGRFHGLKMMDLPTTFLRWVQRECPWQIERVPGMADYIASRCNDDVRCVRSTTREARPEPRGKTPRQIGIKRERVPAPAPVTRRAPTPQEAEDLFALGRRLRGELGKP